jgi:hypothetical protein
MDTKRVPVSKCAIPIYDHKYGLCGLTTPVIDTALECNTHTRRGTKRVHLSTEKLLVKTSPLTTFTMFVNTSFTNTWQQYGKPKVNGVGKLAIVKFRIGTVNGKCSAPDARFVLTYRASCARITFVLYLLGQIRFVLGNCFLARIERSSIADDDGGEHNRQHQEHAHNDGHVSATGQQQCVQDRRKWAAETKLTIRKCACCVL